MIPKPRFLQKQIQDVKIGTFKRIATVQETATVYEALSVFVERRVSALPVVNKEGTFSNHKKRHIISVLGNYLEVCCFDVCLFFFFYVGKVVALYSRFDVIVSKISFLSCSYTYQLYNGQ